MDTLAFLFNPSSGRGKSLKKRRKLEARLKQYDIKYEWFVSESESHLRELARDLAKNFSILVTVGGDTTFTIVATEVLSSPYNPSLAMAGTGSANDIARGLGMYDFDSLCRLLKAGQKRKMDVGEIVIAGKAEKIYFFGALSLGLGAEVSRYVETLRDRHPFLSRMGRINQTLAGIAGIQDAFSRKVVPSRVMLKTDGIHKEMDFSLIVFTNLPFYASGLKLSPDASPFNGKLECCLVHSTSLVNTLAVGSRVYNGTHRRRDEVKILSGTSFDLSFRDKIDLQYDGEIISGISEFNVTVWPAALSVITERKV